MLHSLILEEVEPVDVSVEELCRRPRRVIWLTVRDGRRIVYKGLPESLRNHPEEVGALKKEYLLALKVESQSVVQTYGFGEHPRLGPVIAMEYVDGVSLDKYIHDEGQHTLPELRERIKIASEIAAALSDVHGAGIAHRDLKPDNILIRKKDRAVKIIDFGHGDAEDFVMYKNSLGTEQYGAPEQQKPSRSGQESDIYSFGKILEELLPERRFRHIRASCLASDASSRPDIKWVKRKLASGSVRTGRWFAITCSAIAVLLIVGGFYYYRSTPAEVSVVNGQIKQADSAKDISGENLVHARIPESPLETVRETDTRIGIPHDASVNHDIDNAADVNSGSPAEIIMGVKRIDGSVDEALDSLFGVVKLKMDSYHKDYYNELVGFTGKPFDYLYFKSSLGVERTIAFNKIDIEFTRGVNNLGLTQSRWIEVSHQLFQLMENEKARVDKLVEEERKNREESDS